MGIHFTKTLLHTCTVQRNTPVVSGSGEAVPSWAAVATDVTCRYVQKRQAFPSEQLSAEFLRADLVLCGPDEDIQEGDRIINIALADGTAVAAGPFEVLSVLTRNTVGAAHKSIQVEAIG